MIRFCPSCHTERPLTEYFCQGELDGRTCGWDLSAELPHPSGWRPETVQLTAVNLAPAEAATLYCSNGHPLAAGDLICFECGAAAVEENANSQPSTDSRHDQPTIIDGWRLLQSISQQPGKHERYLAEQAHTGNTGVLTLYANNAEPDPAIYDVLKRLPEDYVPHILASGRWNDRAYEVIEQLTGQSLADLSVSQTLQNIEQLKPILRELGQALHAFNEAGLRHRDLRPSCLLVRSLEPLDLVISGFGSARLSEFDLDIVSPLEVGYYSAPEVIAGGVAAASDWWSLGMILLEQLTSGACFSGINQQAFLIHVLTNGVNIPADLPADVQHLLHGLLARDRLQRWQWPQLEKWLAGQWQPLPQEVQQQPTAHQGSPLVLGDNAYTSPSLFAIAASEAEQWPQAVHLLEQGAVTTWAQQNQAPESLLAQLRELQQQPSLDSNFKLMLSLKLLNADLPLIYQGQIITPNWLLEHSVQGYTLISEEFASLLAAIDPQHWLLQLHHREPLVRQRAEQQSIQLNEQQLRIYLLCASKAQLSAQWHERLRFLPDSPHFGIQTLSERSLISEEDLIVLLSADISQFRSKETIIAATQQLAEQQDILTFDPELAEQQLSLPRTQLYQQVEQCTTGFASCGAPSIDAWVEQFRLEKRLPLEQILLILAVPNEQWLVPEKYQYFSQILQFFQKKLATSVLRGPLARMRLSATSARVDISELQYNDSPEAILQPILRRAKQKYMLALDPLLTSRLRRLSQQSEVYRRDTGIDGLYIGFPFLIQPVKNAQPRLIPLLLWPVSLEVDPLGRRAYIAFDSKREEVRLNPALETLLGADAQQHYQQLLQQLLQRSTLDIQEVIQVLTGHTADDYALSLLPPAASFIEQQNISLHNSAVIFHVTYLGQAIAQDLLNLQQLNPTQTSLETLLRLSSSPELTSETQLSYAQRFLITASDPSQEQAVALARNPQGLLIEGPPGTGKSQTIVNIVADAIGQNKSILIICQKHAALEVVHKRLVAEGLAQRLLMINDMNGDRLNVIREVRTQLEQLHASASYDPRLDNQRQQLAQRIEQLEQSLDQQHQSLQRYNPEMGMSYRDILCALIALEQQPSVDAPLLSSWLAKLTANQVQALEQNCVPLVALWLQANFQHSPLAELQVFDAANNNLSLFNQAWQQLLAVENQRHQTLGSSLFEIADIVPYEQWQQQFVHILLALNAPQRLALAQHLPLFAQSNQGQQLLKRLQTIQQQVLLLPLQCAYSWADALQQLDQIGFSKLHNALQQVNKRTWTGYFNPLYWLKRTQVTHWFKQHSLQPTAELISSALAEADIESQWRSQQQALRTIYQTLGIALAPQRLAQREQLNQLINQLTLAQQLHLSLANLSSSKLLYQALTSSEADALRHYLSQLGNAYQRHYARQASLQQLSDMTAWLQPVFISQLTSFITQNQSALAKLNSITDQLSHLPAYQQFRQQHQHLSATEQDFFALLHSYRPALMEVAPEQLTTLLNNTLYKQTYLGWKQHIEQQTPQLMRADDETQAQIQQLAAADQALRQLNQHYLQCQIMPSRLAAMRKWEDITRIRGARSRRLREFIELGIPLGLFHLRPVWLMNPDTASRVLPLTAKLFDLVVYDEASQMPIEYALPTLYRARSAIISGDEKQMPPTSFFSSQIETDEEPSDNELLDADNEQQVQAWNQREIKDCPDLLQLARSILHSSTLQIHYRSQYRELINYSNAAFYANQLNIPVRHPNSLIAQLKPIELVAVNGLYEQQTNLAEAQAIVAYLAKYWQTQTQPASIGIVTFNRKQADLIEDQIEAYALENPEFLAQLAVQRKRTDHNEDMSLFVKNVENVQGDERDIILFSTTFGRNKQGTFRRNFGVLGQVGGERRLNVAITRAREKVMLFCSMPIADISDMLSTARAPQSPRDYLQGYLSYAQQLSTEQFTDSEQLLRRVQVQYATPNLLSYSQDQFLNLVENYIQSLGYRVVRLQGKNDVFALDFAIIHPKTESYALGINCDAPVNQLLQHARAREIWRKQLLQKAIGQLHQISSQGWYQQREQEQAKLRSAIAQALAQSALAEQEIAL